MEKFYIGISGVSEQPSDTLVKYVNEFLSKIREIRVKLTFVLGGYWGFMKYFADKAIESNYEVVFILPSDFPETPPNRDNT
ncbi:MAG: hypothetical protein QXX35_00610, partial [Desulfurococcaceae archaeon]